MEFILTGQPNCGKSTIFNEIAGYKTIASNFPGATVQYTKSEIDFKGRRIGITDLPGLYSSQTMDEAELQSIAYIRNAGDDVVIINVIDASVLARSLELTIQLATMNLPMVVCLNMMDEAKAKGITIDVEKLSEKLGVPVIPTVGKKGKGIYETFDAACEVFVSGTRPNKPEFNKDTENLLTTIANLLAEAGLKTKWDYRFLALKMLEKDEMLYPVINDLTGNELFEKIYNEIRKFERKQEKESEFMVSAARHDLAFRIFKETTKLAEEPVTDFRTRLDNILMHPFYGYISLAVILVLIFQIIFTVGNLLEPLFLDYMAMINNYIAGQYGADSLTYAILSGFVEGFGGGIGIVIPYLLPFFICLAFLEDSGYLARVAYLIDNLMHQIGLHGLSVIPMILGYGCTVPGILATRILRSPRDKFITATLTTLVPCSARMTLIFGLVGFFISIKAAILIYVLNIIVLGITGKFLSKVLGDSSPGMILEIPKYHLPDIKVVFTKTWFRLKEFLVVAWPLLVLGSIVLEVINYYDLTGVVNQYMEPFTSGVLGLPAVLGITLIFGIMRKELALILLFSALGTHEVLQVMSFTQILSFTIFVTFYVPCLATIAALARELSWGKALGISGITAGIALVLAVMVRLVVPIIPGL